MHVKCMNLDFFSQRHKGTQRSQSICLISFLLLKNLRFFRDFCRLKKRHRTKALCPLRSLCLCEKKQIHAFNVEKWGKQLFKAIKNSIIPKNSPKPNVKWQNPMQNGLQKLHSFYISIPFSPNFT